MTQNLLVRMPPSPTGHLHLGTARAALFNWLFAKTNGGKIIFRWEDTDKDRSKAEYETEILDGLKWLGMDFIGKGDGFFRQTENLDTHKKYLENLWKSGKVFPCFTTPSEVDAMRLEANNNRTNFVFWSPFRELDRAAAETRMTADPFVWRIKTPKNTWIEFKDLIRKKVSVNTDTLGDFTVARSNGSVLYLLANVIDDHTQDVTHVIRGEDHVSNTPKQILLYEALDWSLPTFGHVPLVFDKNKKKLSKRNVEPGVAVLIKDFQELGFIPEAVVNGLVFLGWNPKSTEEIFSFADLEKAFDITNVNAAPAQYDFDKMLWFNAQWLRKIDIEKLETYYQDWSGEKIPRIFLDLARQKGRTLVEIKTELKYLVADPGFNPELLANERFGLDAARSQGILGEIINTLSNVSVENFTSEMIKAASIEKIKELELKNGEFLWPFRVALSNRTGSAGPFDIAAAIGKDATMKRLERARG